MVRCTVLEMLFVIVVALFGASDAAHHERYCNLATCDGQPHTACLFATSKVSDKCLKVLIDKDLTTKEKIKIIQLHNELRQKVASGQETRGSNGPQPAAKSMPDLEWDEELAKIAQKWANQCKFEHDQCRDVKRFPVGQNIAYFATTADVDSLKVEDMVQMWYDEVQNYNKDDVARYDNGQGANGQDVGHYTQMVWAKTTKLGCGAVKYRDRKFNRFYLVCNYGPSGNFIGEPVYEAVKETAK